MGSTKSNMKTTKKKAPKKSSKDRKKSTDSLFGRFSKRKKLDAPQTFADMIEMADECLNKLLTEKEVDLEKEKGDERYNTVAVAYLESMRFHLDCIMDHAGAYGELRDE